MQKLHLHYLWNLSLTAKQLYSILLSLYDFITHTKRQKLGYSQDLTAGTLSKSYYIIPSAVIHNYQKKLLKLSYNKNKNKN